MPFNLDQALNAISERYTPEMRAEDEKRNQQLRLAVAPKIDPNSFEQRTARAREQIANLLDQLDMLKAAEPSELRDTRLRQTHRRLTELFAEAGEPLIAASYAEDADQKEWFGKIYEAIQRPDNERCTCPDDRVTDRNGPFRAASRMPIGTMPSADRGRNVTITRCVKCGDLQAN